MRTWLTWHAVGQAVERQRETESRRDPLVGTRPESPRLRSVWGCFCLAARARFDGACHRGGCCTRGVAVGVAGGLSFALRLARLRWVCGRLARVRFDAP